MLLVLILGLASVVFPRFAHEVPFVFWSDYSSEITKISSSDSKSSSELIDIVKPLITPDKPEIVVLYLESQLHTYEVSKYISESSVFSIIKNEMAKNKHLVVPFAQVETSFASSLGSHLNANSAVYHSGQDSSYFESDKFTKLDSINQLRNNVMLSDGKVDLLIIELNHEYTTFESKYTISGSIMKEVEEILNGVKHASIYTGLTSNMALPFATEFLKRSSEIDFEVNEPLQTQNETSFMPILPIYRFNYWFPGWFWELGAVCFIIFFCASFGIYHLFNLPITMRLAVPKKIKHH